MWQGTLSSCLTIWARNRSLVANADSHVCTNQKHNLANAFVILFNSPNLFLSDAQIVTQPWLTHKESNMAAAHGQVLSHLIRKALFGIHKHSVTIRHCNTQNYTVVMRYIADGLIMNERNWGRMTQTNVPDLKALISFRIIYDTMLLMV